MASPIPPPWLVQPLDPANFDLPGSLPDPGFTQLVNDTLGDLGTPADGVDQAITDVLGLVDQLGQALDASDNALDDALTALAAADTHPASDSFTGYLETFSAGNTLINGANALAVPVIGPLRQSWLSPGAVPVAPPVGSGVQVPGQITVGDAPFVFKVTRSIVIGQGGSVQSIDLLNANSVITAAHLLSTSAVYNKVPPNGVSPVPTVDAVIGIDVHPVQAGTFEVFIRVNGPQPLPAAVQIAVDVAAKP